MRPLAIELFAGKFGWGEGLVAAGFRVVGFDILHEEYHKPIPPGCELILQDVRTIHGAQFKDADLIVASPPCQEFSYRAMPWKRAKALPPPVLGIDLFWQAWRIQHEAEQASGREIPLVVENVRGAEKWIGFSRWHFGSFYLWGDVPVMMPFSRRVAKVPGLNWSGSDKPGYVAKAFNGTAEQRLRDDRKAADPEYTPMARFSSRSAARKAASAQIAKIPFPLAHWIGQVYLPGQRAEATA